MSDWVTYAVESLGYGGIVPLMLLENVIPPIPSELIMPLAGFQAARGEMTFWGVVAAGTAGSVLGALPLYYLGRVIGEERLRRWVGRHGDWLALSTGDLDKGKAWFARRGGVAVFLCRLVSGVRSLISIPAGVHRMRLVPFLVYTAAGTGMWAALLAYAGGLLGQNYRRVETWLGPVTYVVFGAIIIGFVVRVIRLKRRRNACPPGGAAIEHEHGRQRRAESRADADRALRPGGGPGHAAREPGGGGVLGPVA